MSSDAHLQVLMRLTKLIGSQMARRAQIPPISFCFLKAVQHIIAPAELRMAERADRLFI